MLADYCKTRFLISAYAKISNITLEIISDCVTADIGLGKDSKTIPMEFGYQCPEIVNITNWIGGYKWPDTFSVEQTAKQITVKRTDSTDGWGMHLRFQCCKGEIAFESFICIF